MFGVVAAVVVVLFAAAILLSRDSGDAPPATGGVQQETAAVEISGGSLPLSEDGGQDAAVGMPIPEVTGENFFGDPVRIARDGVPKMIVFMAHWCPHCQVEVPIIQEWLDAGSKPEGIQVIGVSTSTSDTQPNYPPSEWLDDEGWSPPTLLDDAAGSVSDAYGLPGFPYFVFVDADGNVVSRASGELPISEIEARLSAL
jgi:thiol-disulfide isomerase/thioredoxin